MHHTRVKRKIILIISAALNIGTLIKKAALKHKNLGLSVALNVLYFKIILYYFGINLLFIIIFNLFKINKKKVYIQNLEKL